MQFDPEDPFPLNAPGTYAEAQAHSAQVDRWLGLDTDLIEREILETLGSRAGHADGGAQLWTHVPVLVHQTPYTEFRWLLDHMRLPPGSRVVDLGAGYGRMGAVIGLHHPDLTFMGFELVSARVAAGRRALQRWSHRALSLEVADLADPGFEPPVADLYFSYDFGTREAIEKVLEDLRLLARVRPVVMVGRGRAVRDAVERRHPWLGAVVPPEHFPHLSIYRSR